MIAACTGTTLLVVRLLDIFTLLLFGRVVLSWFPLSPDSPMATIYGFLYTLTEPVLGPVRRIIPPLGMFDVSVLVVFFGLQILRGVICSG